MPTPVSDLTLKQPKNLKQALAMLDDDPSLTPIAGCTDVYVGLQFGSVMEKRFLDLWALKELRGIAMDDGMVRVGALTTFTDLIGSKLVQRRLPMLVAASREVGGAQIQNRGTLGGNIANASPAGDSLPVLAAAGAQIVLRSQTGERTVPFESFYTGYRTSVRKPDELITAIAFPRVNGTQWWRKVGTRRAQAISKIMMAAVRGPEVRVAIGSVAPTVVLAHKAAAVLSNGGTIADAQEALRSEIAPIDDVRSTKEYRVKVAENLLASFWTQTA